MALLDGITQNQYYQGDNYGNYQFVSLNDIIKQFMVVYVGDGKLIKNASRTDVAFFAQRALAELSFDTFKSIKSQQIELPASLQMILPHDYVNYTKISHVDDSGIKHVLYPTKHTNNPFEVKQNDNGSYFFGEEGNNVKNPEFDVELTNTWNVSRKARSSAWSSFRVTSPSNTNPIPKYYANYVDDIISVSGSELSFSHLWNNGFGVTGGSNAYGAWQKINVKNASFINLKSTATSGAKQTGTFDDGLGGTETRTVCEFGVVRVGITYTDPSIGWPDEDGILRPATNTRIGGNNITPNNVASNYELGYLEWSDGTTSQKEIESIDVTAYDDVWVYIQSYSPWTSNAVTTVTNTYDHDNDASTPEVTVPLNGATVEPQPSASTFNTHQENTVDFVSVIVPGQNDSLEEVNAEGNSSTWTNFKSVTPSEVQNKDYEDEVYWPYEGERYGLEPSHAQINGSFYIDELRGKIHFSSNISGQTVILDYISDSLGTEEEMQVHKFAEEAMYRYILHGIASSQIMTQQLVPRLKREKFAAIRQAKLRLSNIKLEELTQILRGKSKHIKH